MDKDFENLMHMADALVGRYIRNTRWLDDDRQKQQQEAVEKWDVAYDNYKFKKERSDG